MSIDRVNQNLAAGAYGAKRSARSEKSQAGGDAAAAGGATARPTDGVELSDQARFVARVNAAVQGAPDVREALVAEIRQRVQDGGYTVDAAAIAERMLAESDG